jgi:PhnB protein
MPTGLLIYVDDADATYQRALAAGATSIMPPSDQFYGDRMGGVTDMCGNQWWIATHIEDVSEEELERRSKTGKQS